MMNNVVFAITGICFIITAQKGLVFTTTNSILNLPELDEGFCDGEEARIKVQLKPKTTHIILSSGNTLFQCRIPLLQSDCDKDTSVGSINETNGVLTFYMKFSYTRHTGKVFTLDQEMTDGNPYHETFTLKICRSGFYATAVHNQTFITAHCEHPSYRLSNWGMIIKEQNSLAECRWNTTLNQSICPHGKALPNGVQLTMDYNSAMKLKCQMDEQSVNISVEEQTTPLDQTSNSATQVLTNNNAGNQQPVNNSILAKMSPLTCLICVSLFLFYHF